MAVQMRYGDYVKEAFELVKANLGASIVLLLIGVIPLVGLIMPICVINYMAGIKAAKNEGKSIAIGDLFNFENAVDKWVGPFLVGLMIMIGSMCVVGGIIAGGLFFFVGPILADKPGTSFMSAIKGALQFGKANLVPCILLSIVLGLVAFVGYILCFVGAFVTVPVAIAASYLAYEDHKAAIEAAAAEGGITL